MKEDKIVISQVVNGLYNLFYILPYLRITKNWSVNSSSPYYYLDMELYER